MPAIGGAKFAREGGSVVRTKVGAKTKKTATARKTGAKRSTTKKTTKKTTTSAKRKPTATVTVDRRKPSERRKASSERRKEAKPVPVERRTIQRRVKVNRRRQIDPTTCERDYTPDELEFMSALDVYKRTSGRMFPTCSEVLEVLVNLGYEKRSEVDSANPPGDLSGDAPRGDSSAEPVATSA